MASDDDRREMMEVVGRLAGGVAHELNNLLTVINGYSDALIEQLPDESPQRADLVLIRDAGERAAELTAQLLAFGRRSIVAPVRLALNGAVERLIAPCKQLLGDRIALVIALAAELADVWIDAAQLDRVILNLVTNARDAMPGGGTLTITTQNLRDQVYLTIADTGAGMTDEVRARVFEPFFSTRPGTTRRGLSSGLGLATAHGIVEQARGEILIDSAPGRGSAFHIVLPAVTSARPACGPSRPVGRGRPSETVLLAEDEDGVRRLLQRALEHHGYSVLPAASGEEAETIERNHGGPIHLLVTDVVMPGMGGRELADTIKSRRPQLKVLYMSGYTNDEVVRHGVIVARDAFLQKPFTPTSLVAMVRATVGA